MCSKYPPLGYPWTADPRVPDPASQPSNQAVEQCDALGAAGVWEELWDAFESDDEMAEPQPEYGDFWGEPDEPDI